MKTLYFDCLAGISGDMTLGALIDAGVPLDQLRSELQKMALSGYTLDTKRENRGAISGTRAIVEVEKGVHQKRHLADILSLFAESGLSPRVKEQATAIFQRLAAAEAGVHGIPIAEIHFHEVGAVDSIVDIVGTCIGLEILGIERIYASSLPTGGGTVNCAHGLLPVPAPATVALLAQAKAPIRPGPTAETQQVELVTPTGAALLAALATFEQPPMRITGIGYGLGSRVLNSIPNVLRVWLGEVVEPTESEGFVLLETNIDDMNPELFGYVLNLLFSKGARDVWFTPIQMKKNRPATMLSVITPASLEGDLATVILRETSTLGIRVQTMRRWEAGREVKRFPSSLGEATVKLKMLDNAIVAAVPEYESCLALAQTSGLPLQDVYHMVAAEARALFVTGSAPA